MSYTLKHALADVTWADGTRCYIPPIDRSQNGWVYRPPEAQTPSTGKSFGKGAEGDETARDWVVRRLQKAFDNKRWEIPVDVPKLTRTPGSLPSDTVQVGWIHPVFGVTYVELRYLGKSGYARSREALPRLQVNLAYNVLAEDIATRTIRWRSQIAETKSTIVEPNSKDELLDNYEKFRRDPWGYATSILHFSPTLKGLLAPPGELPSVDYTGKAPTDTEDSWYKMEGNVDLLFDQNAAKHVTQKVKEIERLLFAFQHLGFEVSVSWDRSPYYAEEAIPTSIKFVVPAQPGVKHQEEPHTVRINQKGIEVECGYAKDETRHLEYTHRHALSYFEEVFEDEWTTTEKQL